MYLASPLVDRTDSCNIILTHGGGGEKPVILASIGFVVENGPSEARSSGRREIAISTTKRSMEVFIVVTLTLSNWECIE